jgi:glycosyltransferase involved in cell wall biosynthesis
MIQSKDILFLGIGKSAVLWYRAALPAMNIGADWCGIVGTPPELHILTGQVRNDTRLPNFDDYKVVILQQPHGPKWLEKIRELQEKGIKVVYEVDDYLHGVRKQPGHDFRKSYTKELLVLFEECMAQCDAMICSTDYIAERYAKFNEHVYVCRNGLDTNRYRLTRPPRPTVNIGWAGATGHMEPLAEWLNKAILPVMQQHDDTCFVVIGQPGFAKPVNEIFGGGRAIGLPWTLIENYPAAMTMMDIAVAPAGHTTWYRGKSDLRWLEAGALGIPIVADATIYSDIEQGVTGFKASTPAEAREHLEALVVDPDLRATIGANAKQHVGLHRTAALAGLRWLEICREIAGTPGPELVTD